MLCKIRIGIYVRLRRQSRNENNNPTPQGEATESIPNQTNNPMHTSIDDNVVAAVVDENACCGAGGRLVRRILLCFRLRATPHQLTP